MEVHRIQEHDRLPECFRPDCWMEAFSDKHLFKWMVSSEGRRGEYSAYYRIGAEWVDDERALVVAPKAGMEEIDWSAYYSSYVKTYLERDVRQLSAVQNLDDFRRFMVAAAARTGQMVNYANIASEIGKDQGTVKNWMSILEASGIVYLLEPFSNSVLKRAIKTPKLYFRDTGLAAYLTRWLTPETLAMGAMSGHMFETFVISEILKSYSNRGIDYRYCVSYYRGKDKKIVKRNGEEKEIESEIDLIIEENGILYPIEIKQNAQVTADETAAFTILDRVEGKKRGMGAVVCLCPQPGILRENVLQLPVWFV